MTEPRPPYRALLAVLLLATGCHVTAGEADHDHAAPPSGEDPAAPAGGAVTSWVYQLQGYPGGRLDALARSPHQLAVIDLARDARSDYFRPAEIHALRRSGKRVLGYFEIGSIEDFRPEYPDLVRSAPDLVLNRWDEWPQESFVKYWDPRWWARVVRPRLDRALRTGFDGVYLDTPLAYEQIPLTLAEGRDRRVLAAEMVALIIRISRYAKQRRPGFLVLPQNSPELRTVPGYLDAVDGIGVEELFYRATDRRCGSAWCRENLENARKVRDAGKLVLAVDYATRPRHIRRAYARYARERFAGYVGRVALDRVGTTAPEERKPQ